MKNLVNEKEVRRLGEKFRMISLWHKKTNLKADLDILSIIFKNKWLLVLIATNCDKEKDT